jgi:hypothetical protein
VNRHDILDRRRAAGIRGTAELDELAEQKIEQIERMAADVEKNPAAGLLASAAIAARGWADTAATCDSDIR